MKGGTSKWGKLSRMTEYHPPPKVQVKKCNIYGRYGHLKDNCPTKMLEISCLKKEKFPIINEGASEGEVNMIMNKVKEVKRESRRSTQKEENPKVNKVEDGGSNAMLMYASTQVSEVPFSQYLIDTGSEVNLMPEGEVKKHRFQISSLRIHIIKGFDGK